MPKFPDIMSLIMSERSREDCLRRRARRDGHSFHRARWPIYRYGFGCRYYEADGYNVVVAYWRDLEAAERAYAEPDVDRRLRGAPG
jgi:hypothetical protein